MYDNGELDAIKKTYDVNSGNQEMERNLDILLEQYPVYVEYKSFILDALRHSYCLGFLNGYKDK